MGFGAWIARKRWLANVERAKLYRETLSFSDRQVFDANLRPQPDGTEYGALQYPGAIYHITIDDYCRAVTAVCIARMRFAEEYPDASLE